MPATTQSIRIALVLAAACHLSGCGGGKDDSLPPPPPPKKTTAEVGVAAPATPDAAPAAAPGATAPPTGQATPPVDPSLPTDIFKGMTPKQIEEYKQTATPETHDLNIGRIQEAAEGFYKEFGHPATSQDQLVKARYLPSVLPAPKGKKYVFNPKSFEVTVENK